MHSKITGRLYGPDNATIIVKSESLTSVYGRLLIKLIRTQDDQRLQTIDQNLKKTCNYPGKDSIHR